MGHWLDTVKAGAALEIGRRHPYLGSALHFARPLVRAFVVLAVAGAVVGVAVLGWVVVAGRSWPGWGLWVLGGVGVVVVGGWMVWRWGGDLAWQLKRLRWRAGWY
jgi:hypothetical protein